MSIQTGNSVYPTPLFIVESLTSLFFHHNHQQRNKIIDICLWFTKCVLLKEIVACRFELWGESHIVPCLS